jgi:predicted DNA-binding transcriptional regulator AlpA
MYLKLTDKQLMEYFGISKTTLWRWKKELAEREKNGQMPF